MENININSAQTFLTPNLFCHAINILITKPHVVNKRLWGCKLLGRYMCKGCSKSWDSLHLPIKLQDSENINEFLSQLRKYMGIYIVSDEDHNLDAELILTELLPKNYGEKHAYQLIFIQRNEMTATFFDVTPAENKQNLCPDFTHRYFVKNHTISLVADVDETSKSYKWLIYTVLPQVNKWSLELSNNSQQSINKSLALVSHDQYYTKYNILKEKYGKELVKIWPECTDPSKFVYEDIAIATYLLLLWEENYEGDKCEVVTSQTFVDMGCGNGLLVYILVMEGHNGYGVDVRKRKIWDTYPKNIKLIVKTITPSNIQTFTEVDWIIGNHSDELTPWIPAVAARSSYECKYFLLPCCAYNFDGTKYQRRNSSKTKYLEYLEYIQKISDDCGFQTDTDRLKIPSTKRICLVGRKRKYEQEEFTKYCESIDTLIKSSTCFNIENNSETDLVESFKAREPTEKVRNCTKVDKNVIDSIITCVTKYLFEGCKMDSSWSPGKTVDISEVVTLLSPDLLKVLKSECGGLQTLFKNNNHIFKVKSGKIQLQYPKGVKDLQIDTANKRRIKTTAKIKVRPCWFYKNHPQGCPLKDVDCSFRH